MNHWRHYIDADKFEPEELDYMKRVIGKILLMNIILTSLITARFKWFSPFIETENLVSFFVVLAYDSTRYFVINIDLIKNHFVATWSLNESGWDIKTESVRLLC